MKPPPLSFFLAVRALVGETKYVQFKSFDPNHDYVGPEGRGWKPPQEIYGVNVRPAAWPHDSLYEIGGSENDREQADLIFHSLMLQLIEDHKFSWWQIGWKVLARYRATTYFEAVRICGGAFFTYRRTRK